jgi:ABC-type phosphonate transport system ATPase subunit
MINRRNSMTKIIKLIGTGLAASVAVAAGVATAGATDDHPTAAAAATTRVPNEVGRNHQKAQDDLQAHGFYNLREKDCSGRDRMLLFDRNWKVVRQSPHAGTRVSTRHAITLCSVKYSDDE